MFYKKEITKLIYLQQQMDKDLEEMHEGESTTGSNIQAATNDSAVAVPMSNNLETVNNDNQIFLKPILSNNF